VGLFTENLQWMASCNGWDKLSGPPTLLQMVIHRYPACKVTV
jgi:hypothetical protein